MTDGMYRIRRAELADLETLVAFTLEGARDAVGEECDLDAVRRGVGVGLEDPSVATYWVAEDPEGEIVASASVVKEWSDWHGGYYWWVQSMFIVAEHRGRGLVDLLLDTIAEAARAVGALDLRLYAHQLNQRALKAYHRCGFSKSPYVIMTRPLNGDSWVVDAARSGRVIGRP